jgi:translation initiation factor 2 subunit 1
MEKKEEVTILHRFFESEYPVIDQLVVVVVTKVEDYCSYVKLLEYSGKEGAIAPNELTRSKRKGQFKALKVGRVEVMRVLQIDKVRGFIDLSKKSVYPNDEKLAKDNYAKVRLVNSMLVGVTEATKCDISLLYEKIIWPLHRRNVSVIDYFKNNLEELDGTEGVPPEIIGRLKAEVERRLKPVAFKIVSLIEVSVDHFRGI